VPAWSWRLSHQSLRDLARRSCPSSCAWHRWSLRLDQGRRTGQTVLVHSVLGGVGALAAQIPAWRGAVVVGTVRRSADLDRLDTTLVSAGGRPPPTRPRGTACSPTAASTSVAATSTTWPISTYRPHRSSGVPVDEPARAELSRHGRRASRYQSRRERPEILPAPDGLAAAPATSVAGPRQSHQQCASHVARTDPPISGDLLGRAHSRHTGRLPRPTRCDSSACDRSEDWGPLSVVRGRARQAGVDRRR